jgi:hypothetical protein
VRCTPRDLTARTGVAGGSAAFLLDFLLIGHVVFIKIMNVFFNVRLRHKTFFPFQLNNLNSNQRVRKSSHRKIPKGIRTGISLKYQLVKEIANISAKQAARKNAAESCIYIHTAVWWS